MDAARRRTIRVVGGGMTGLTLALRLASPTRRVIVHEAVPYLGGLSGEDRLGGIPVERFYHCVLPSDTALLALFKEIGIAEAIGWTRTRTGFFTGDALLEMTTRLDFLRFPVLGPIDRLRLAWTILSSGRRREPGALDHEPVGRYLRRHSGRRVFETIWEPLLLSKLGPDYDRFAASFIWATIARMLSARKAKGRAEQLGFVRGRYGRVFAALRQELEARGGGVEVGQPVLGLARGPSGTAAWRVRLPDGEREADAVALCVPGPVAAPWLRELGIPSSLERLEYLGVICEALLLRRSLTPYYVLNLIDRALPFTGVIETSNLVGPDELDGHHLVYLPRYRPQHHEEFEADDTRLHRENLAGLRRIVPGLREEEVLAWRVHRAPHVQPVHGLGAGDRLPSVHLAPGLAYCSTAQVHPWPIFNDEVVRLVDRRRDELCAVLESTPLPPASA